MDDNRDYKAEEDSLYAKTDAYGNESKITLHTFQNWIYEVKRQPDFRKTSDKCCDYYDGNQLDADDIQRSKDLGIGLTFENIVKPPINLVLGMEAKSRTDWRVNADVEEWTDVAEGLSQMLFEAERETRSDRACAEGFAHQVKAGFGFVEVSREYDPFKYRYRVESVHRNEIYWDFTAKKADLSDAKYLIRSRWMDVDILKIWFPEHKDFIYSAYTGSYNELSNYSSSELLSRAYDQETRTTMDSHEWRDVDNRKCRIYECWYRVNSVGDVLRLADGRAVEFDKDNQKHIEMVQSGQADMFKAVISNMRMSWWMGCHLIFDTESPYEHNDFPYVPFFGYREDLTNIPYSMIRDVIPLQDEDTARRTKLLKNLSSKRVIRTVGAVVDVSTMLDEIARPDSDIELNAEAMRNNGVFRVEDDSSINSQHFQMMQQSQAGVERVTSVYQSTQGSPNTGATSGIAINSLVEQSSTALANVFDSYRFSRRKVGELLLNLIRQDIGTKPTEIAITKDELKYVKLNQPVQDETGQTVIVNDVKNSLVKVSLEDVTTSSGYKMQQQMFLSDAIKSATPQIQAMLMPYYFELSQLPRKKEIVKEIKAMMGMDAEAGKDAQSVQNQQIIQQLQGQLQQAQAQLADKQADRDKDIEIAKMRVDGNQQLQQTKNDQEIEKMAKQINQLSETVKYLSEFINEKHDKELQDSQPSDNGNQDQPPSGGFLLPEPD